MNLKYHAIALAILGLLGAEGFLLARLLPVLWSGAAGVGLGAAQGWLLCRWLRYCDRRAKP